MEDGKIGLDLTYSEGAFLMRYVAAQLPEKMGEDTYDSKVQATCDDQLKAMRECLRKVSPWSNPPKSLVACFGDSEAWEPPKPVEWKCECGKVSSQKVDGFVLKKDWAQKIVRSLFSEDGIYGIWWALLQATHPRSKARASIIDLDETVWSIAQKAGWLEDLRDKLGLSKKPEFLPKNNRLLKTNGEKALPAPVTP